MVNMIIAVITGCIFYRLDEQTDVQKIIRDRTGALFFISINLMFSNMSALEIFLKERVIFVHEKVVTPPSKSCFCFKASRSSILPFFLSGGKLATMRTVQH